MDNREKRSRDWEEEPHCDKRVRSMENLFAKLAISGNLRKIEELQTRNAYFSMPPNVEMLKEHRES